MDKIAWIDADGVLHIDHPVINTHAVVDGVLVAVPEDVSQAEALQRALDKRQALTPGAVPSVIAEAALPADRVFRRAWRLDAGAVVENAAECCAIHAERIQAAKRERLRELRDREDDGENVAAERAALRAVNPQAEAASKTPAELRAHWPAAVERRGAPR